MLCMDQQFSNFEQIQQPSQLIASAIRQPPTFPTHSSRPYNNTATLIPITSMVQEYHNQQWIRLQDQIQFDQKDQYLKRIYGKDQQNNKIKLLGEYYRYHCQMARLFPRDLLYIIQENYEEKRMLEYDLVTKQLSRESNKTELVTTTRLFPHQRLLKEIQVSYTNFEDREPKQQEIIVKQKKQKNKANRQKQNDGILKRTTSIKNKGGFFISMQNQKNTQNTKKQGEILKQTNKYRNQNNISKQSKYDKCYKKPKTSINSKNKIKSNQCSQKNSIKKSTIILHDSKNKGQQNSNKNGFKSNNCSEIKSKMTSVNNSMVSTNRNTKTLSRSQSRNQLNMINPQNSSKDTKLKNDKYSSNKQRGSMAKLHTQIDKYSSKNCNVANTNSNKYWSNNGDRNGNAISQRSQSTKITSINNTKSNKNSIEKKNKSKKTLDQQQPDTKNKKPNMFSKAIKMRVHK